MEWSVVYKRAIEKDGTLLFPERLTAEFLEQARRSMGSYLYANQYLNEVIPDEEKSFKDVWLKEYQEVPERTYRFGFIDPAIGQSDHHDYTGIAIIDVDLSGVWYLRIAARYRLTPTQIVDKMFELCDEFQLKCLGVEAVAYQEALLYVADQEMKRRQRVIPVRGIKRTHQSKATRILGLVPRFEWGRLLIAPGLTDFKEEYQTFPRGSHDDILDAIASLEEIVFYPEKEKEKKLERPNSPHDADYERWIIQEAVRRQNAEQDDSSGSGID